MFGDPVNGFTNLTMPILNAMPSATNELKKKEPLTSYSMHLKINNYLPLLNKENNADRLIVDTWSRDTRLPSFFYEYFLQTFMIPSYTCH